MLRSIAVVMLTALAVGLLCELVWGFFWAGLAWALIVLAILEGVLRLVDLVDGWIAEWRHWQWRR